MTKQEYRGSPHTSWAEEGKVFLANEEDPYYTEEFRSREELEVFIQQLRATADKAWPS
jgi:hypothetical protein